MTPATAATALRDLLRRGVLDDRSGQVRARVTLFGAWLQDEGAYQLPDTDWRHGCRAQDGEAAWLPLQPDPSGFGSVLERDGR